MKQLLQPLALIFILTIAACSTSKNASVPTRVVSLDTLPIFSTTPELEYQPSETRYFDLIHTKLEVKFDWEKQYLYGKAQLRLKPYFYPQKTLLLDAKGFDIQEIALVGDSIKTKLEYSYDSSQISIQLNKEYTRKDTIEVFVKYTAKPNELVVKGSKAIVSDKGLYFINPLNKNPNKPQQIWTQGETESSSCWFPTIDIPNEKMTQELYITVQNKYKTLSNGELVFQTENGDGTRTDYWKQDLPHTPYLVMMAVGDFAVVEDEWRDSIDVHYFVEQEYEPFAQEIFGTTPEMMELFSTQLGVDYPWDKYHQIVVRDYVSGAMENTGAVIHGDFVQQTHREMIDENNEDIIAHELFHHWFGDLVTCESWSNLPLNESFATYGEYLWREHKHGRASADAHLEDMLEGYLRESQYKKEDMIRYEYFDKEDMFDSHSYSKGGRILHMLRKYVGDDAFFASLKLYLTRYGYKTAEIHDLRMVFEEITGEDLNWFFNQWFLSKGHPQLSISSYYDDSLKQQHIEIEQLQDLKEEPLYKLPIAIDFYTSKGKERKQVIINKQQQDFVFNFMEEPLLVNVDAEKMLLCEKEESKSVEQWIYQYKNAPLFIDKKEAIDELAKSILTNNDAAETVFKALKDKDWNIRLLALDKFDLLIEKDDERLEATLIDLAKNDPKSYVRADAIAFLGEEFATEKNKQLFIDGTNEQSYEVLTQSLIALASLDEEEGLKRCKAFEKETNKTLIENLCYIYSGYGTDEQNDYFVYAANNLFGFSRIGFINDYEYYLTNGRSKAIVLSGIELIKNMGLTASSKYVSSFAKQALRSLEEQYTITTTHYEEQLAKAPENSSETTKLKALNAEGKEIIEAANRALEELKR